MMIAWLLRDQDDRGDGACRVGMLLEGGIPEILRKVLPANGEADRRRLGVAGEREREADLDRAAVGPLGLALETQGIRDADAGGAKLGRVGNGVAALEDHERQPLLFFQEDPVEGAEQRREGVAAELLGLRHGQELDEEARQLDDMIVGAPGMPVARADGEAEPAIERGRGVEVAHGMDDMVEAAPHHLTAENAVGCRNRLLIEATIGPSRSLSARLA